MGSLFATEIELNPDMMLRKLLKLQRDNDTLKSIVNTSLSECCTVEDAMDAMVRTLIGIGLLHVLTVVIQVESGVRSVLVLEDDNSLAGVLTSQYDVASRACVVEALLTWSGLFPQ